MTSRWRRRFPRSARAGAVVFVLLAGAGLAPTSPVLSMASAGTPAGEDSSAPFAPFGSWSALVRRVFVDVTAKAPTASELNTWVAALSSGSKSKGELVDALRRGTDNTTNVDPVARLYRAFLGRTPDAGGLDFWVRRRRSGTWTLVRTADHFAASSEFNRKYGSLSNRAFVNRIYTDVMGRTADPGGLDYWTRQLDLKRRTRGGVMVGFSESNEYKRKQADNTDVAVAYIFLLDRAPTATEATDWLTSRTAGTTHAELLTQLLDSPTYATHIADTLDYDWSEVDRLMASKLTSVALPGASLVVWHEGDQVFEEFYGSYRTDTVVPIASGSKWLSAAAIMTLVDEGSVELDAPISRYLPQFTGTKGTVTLRQLLSFTSGLAANPTCAGARGWTISTCTDWIAGRPTENAPGREYRYGDGHLVVAARIAETISGKPWATFFRDAIAVPVGMTQTAFAGANPNPASGARSTIHDYSRFVQMIAAEGRASATVVLEPSTVREMQEDQTGGARIVVASGIRKALGSRYGFGEWRDVLDPVTGGFEVSSPGAFGMHPWIDHTRDLAAVYFVYYPGSQNEFLAGGWDVKAAVREAIDDYNSRR